MDTLTESYTAALPSMEGRKPRPLQPHAAFIAAQNEELEADVSLAALCERIRKSRSDDPLHLHLHLAIAAWDAAIADEWREGTDPTTPERRHLVYRLLGFDDTTSTVMDAAFPLPGPPGPIISDTFEPWYSEDRQKAHNFYWNAYRIQLLTQGWNVAAVSALDAATTSVVERLSDPTRDPGYQSKGLVVGYVQSGKTANFTGVIAKAIDAGYRLIIVLTGTMDILRQQTQRRMDMELVGVENIFLGVDPDDPEQARDYDYFTDADRLGGKFLSHGFEPAERGHPNIVRLTGFGSDYRRLNTGITTLELEKRDRRKPLFDPENLDVCGARLAVVKKNAAVLRHLVRDLKTIRTQLIEIPTLIIDDESDQASVNTTDPRKIKQGAPERTTINGLISELLDLLKRAQYVGYTATPYANVFIDPSDSEDIFPKDFLISLNRPDGYMGVTDFHDLDWNSDETKTVESSNEKAFVRDLRATGPGPDADAELQNALDAFVLSGAIKLYREANSDGELSFRHHTMLIHESIRTAEQRDLAQAVRHVWDRSGYTTPEGAARLSVLLERDFRPVSASRAPGLPFPSTFADLKDHVGEAWSRISSGGGNPVLVVNGDKDIVQENLDFETRPIWRILVGGAKLSRGFTVEGLTISYFRRTARYADSLMQMGRWFGFRRGYNDLVRLFIARVPANSRGFDLYEAFEAIVRDEEAFRGQLRRYATIVDGKPQITPRDIPPLVSQHLPTITPAAPNRMFNAELVLRRTPGEPLEPTAYPKEPQEKAANYAAMLPLLQCAQNDQFLSYPANSAGGFNQYRAFVGEMSAGGLLRALEALTWLRPDYFTPNLAYLREITGAGVHDWVVIAPQLNIPRSIVDLPDVGPRTTFGRDRRQREGSSSQELFGAISDPKYRPAASRICGAADPAGWQDPQVDDLIRPQRGSIVLYPIIEPATGQKSPVNTTPAPSDLLIGFQLFAPAAAIPTNGQRVQFRAKNRQEPRAAIIPSGFGI